MIINYTFDTDTTLLSGTFGYVWVRLGTLGFIQLCLGTFGYVQVRLADLAFTWSTPSQGHLMLGVYAPAEYWP